MTYGWAKINNEHHIGIVIKHNKTNNTFCIDDDGQIFDNIPYDEIMLIPIS